MTNEQYENYQRIKKEIEPVKRFLEWSGKKYKNESVSLYRFSIKKICAKFGLYMHRIFCTVPENTFEIPIELQNRIVETIEKYVEEKEQEMELI